MEAGKPQGLCKHHSIAAAEQEHEQQDWNWNTQQPGNDITRFAGPIDHLFHRSTARLFHECCKKRSSCLVNSQRTIASLASVASSELNTVCK
jgi:hypothetical protein